MKHSYPFYLIVFFISSLSYLACDREENPVPVNNSPQVNGFTPSTAAVGEQVTITGSNFSASVSNNTVKFNGVNAVISSGTSTQLVVIVPQGASTGRISVLVNGQTATSVTDFILLGMVSTVAGNGIAGFADGTGASAQFSFITDLITDQTGNIFVPDNNYRIRKINPNGVVTTIAGSGVNQFADGVGSAASFSTMLGISIDATDNLYIADLGNHRIRKVTQAGVVTTIGGSIPGYLDGPVANSRFYLPMGVAVSSTGDIYVADAGNNRIRKISTTGMVSTVAGDGVAGHADGAAATARFSNPIKIKIDMSDNLIILDQNNNRVRKITPAGIVSTIAGNGMQGFLDGPAATAQFGAPAGLAIDPNNNIYIGDQLNNRIRKISNGVVSTIAGTGIAGYNDGNTSVAKFYNPTGLHVTSSGLIYIADNQNHRVRKITF